MFPINLRLPPGGGHRDESWGTEFDRLLSTCSWLSLAFVLTMIAIGVVSLWLKVFV